MRTAVIIGTGMIGTSIGLALRKQGVDSYLMDTSPVALRIAEAVGAGTAEEPPETVDLAVVAVPAGPRGTGGRVPPVEGNRPLLRRRGRCEGLDPA